MSMQVLQELADLQDKLTAADEKYATMSHFAATLENKVDDINAKLAAAEADRDERLRVQVAEKHEALRLMDKAYQRADALEALVREVLGASVQHTLYEWETERPFWVAEWNKDWDDRAKELLEPQAGEEGV